MNIRFNYLFLLSFFAFIPLNIWSTTCQEIYQAQAVFANASWNYKDELQFINALNQQDHPTNSSAYKKYAYLIKKLPFSPKQTFDILRIGFNEQIFCNPWPLRMPQIIKRLLSGEFSNSLLREINRYQQENESYSGQASFIFSDYELRSLKKNLEHIPSPFPQEVNIRDTYQQDFTSNFFYFLRKKDGKIFIKPNPKKGNKADIIKFGELEHHQENNKLGNRTEWNLFNNNGGPQLDKGKKIVQFSVASEIVFALDNTGQFHIFKPTEFKTPTKWSSFVGAPIPEKLYIPRGHKTWSLSSSLKIKPEQRRSIEFMHPDDIVHYYEDADNKKIEFGFTTTAYVLSKDGRKIYYWDTGLPANFGRAFTTPHRGNFIAQNLSAQGSTIMVIGLNPEGKYEIYTRMFDYEINGACPGEQHTYQKTQAPIPDRVLGLIEAKRRLPLPGWKKMPDILLGSEDFITTKISIELTGQGNSARMLKVRGSQNGVPGYYQKMLDATQWEFIEATQISDKTFDVYGFDLSHQALYGIDNDMNYQGKILSFSSLSPHKKHYISSIELKKFHYFLGADEPSTIEITTQNKRKLYLRLHTNDAWTLTTQKKRREALIGNKDGEPKP
ncbi:MAG: hypothetical protein KC505_01430, partial [Myxococcales bacterium]|nr:hypothetical protein [Myxococcales bacterium]